MVTAVPALAPTGAYQISVVTPLALFPGFAACDARFQVVTLAWVIEVTVLLVVPRVAITATRVFPLVGARPKVTAKVAAPLPETPKVATCTRAGAA